jgi:hypothetical protein
MRTMPHFDDFAAEMQFVAGLYGCRPAKLVDSQSDDADLAQETTLDEQAHRHGTGVPPAGDQIAEKTVPRGAFVEMKDLWVERARERDDLGGGNAKRDRLEGLANGKIF